MNEWPPTTPPPKTEDETNPEENQEELSVSQIVEKIKNGEQVGEEEEKILKEKIENVILEEKTEDEWTVEEGEMMAAYLKGVEMEWFKDGDLTKVTVDFDLETIKFNRSDEKDKKEKISDKKEKFKDDLAGREIIVEDFEEMEDAREEMEKRLTEQVIDHGDILEQIKNEELKFDELGKAKLKEMIHNLRENDQNLLDLHKFEYYFDDIDDLIKEYHTEKIYIIKMLEETLGAYDQIIILLEKKEEELTEEEKGLLTKLFKLMKENPKNLLAILAILAALGLIAAYGPGLLAGLAGEQAAEEIAKEVVKQIIGKGAGLAGVGAAVGAAGLLGAIYALTDEDQRDGFMEFVCGVKVPGWSRVNKKSKD